MTRRTTSDSAVADTITEIRPLHSDPNYRSIRVNGRTVARLRDAVVESLQLAVGQRWTAERAARVEAKVREEKSRKAALSMLGRRALPQREVEQRLLKRGHDQGAVRTVVEELVRDGWIDDDAYARSLAEELAGRKGASHRLIVERLQQRQLDPETAEAAADAALRERNPLATARALALKKLNASRQFSIDVKARRISGLLARRGYDEETIETTLRDLDLLPD